MTPERPLALKADHARAAIEAETLILDDVNPSLTLSVSAATIGNLARAYLILSRAGADREAELRKALEQIAEGRIDGAHIECDGTIGSESFWRGIIEYFKSIARAALSPQEQDDGR